MKSMIYVAIIVSMVGAGMFIYFKASEKKVGNLNDRIEQLVEVNTQLRSNQEQLKESLSASNETIEFLEKSYANVEKAYDKALLDFDAIRSQNVELKNRLEKHDLGKISSSKPERMEDIINNASNNANRCFELMTGSPKTSAEKSAKSGVEFNSECPWLWEGTKK